MSIYNIHWGKVNFTYETKRKINRGSIECMFRTGDNGLVVDDRLRIKIRRQSKKDNFKITGFDIIDNHGLSLDY